MKFPLTTLNKDEYLKTISLLLSDKDCYLFIDTNIFALYFQIYASARKEFLDWIEPLIEQKRVKTPLWALNEYSNRFIRDQVGEYFSPLYKVKTLQKEFREIGSFLKRNIDSNGLKGTPYKTIDDYINDLAAVENSLENISSVAKKKDIKYKAQIHEELKKTFERTVINTDLAEICKVANEQGEFRFAHKLPPGFEDEGKEQNKMGDLIIWLEILKCCKQDKIKKAILITNDNKRDWVYAPARIIENSYEIPNSQPLFKIVDTRLVNEFKNYTDSEDFHIVNFETLTKVLLKSSQVSFIELARALQIATVNENASIQSIDNEGDLSEIDNEFENDNPVVDSIKKQGTISYSKVALADKDFPLYDRSELTYIIRELKTANWYSQNPALIQFMNTNWQNLEQSQNNADKLFVLGRNICQAASGGANVAVEYLQNLSWNIQQHNDFVVQNIYAGILYEVYFNSQNVFRQNSLKAIFLSEILNVANPRVNSSLSFVNAQLQPFSNLLVVLPSIAPKPVKISIKYKKTQTKSEWNEGEENIDLVEEIKINGINFLTERSEDAFEGTHNYYSYDIKNWLLILTMLYGIPSQFMEIEWQPPKNEGWYKLAPGKFFKKLPLKN